MSYPINYPTPQGANVQIFKKGGSVSDWVKPQGASFVWFTLIGSGGSGGIGSTSVGGGGGGSGAVTNFMGPAFLMPDVLRVYVSKTSNVNSSVDNTTVSYQAKDGTGYTLLTANGGVTGTTAVTGGAAGAASTSNYFSAMGFFQSIAGQIGTAGGSTLDGTNQNESATTFLSGGAGGSGSSTGFGGWVIPNYKYLELPATAVGGTVKGADGYFVTSPILVGCGGAGGSTSTTVGTAGGRGGIGCGGGGAGEDALLGGVGGDGMVVIITW